MSLYTLKLNFLNVDVNFIQTMKIKGKISKITVTKTMLC